MPKRSAPKPEDTTPEDPMPEPAEAAAAEAAEPATEEPATDEPVFANRAERRAHGKGKPAQPPAQKGHYPHGQGSRQGPRMWGNRRSG
jgi:hypothetical protein